MFEINQLQFIFCTTEGFLLEGQKLRVIGTQDEENTIDNFSIVFKKLFQLLLHCYHEFF